MNDERMNHDLHDADQLDALITAAHARTRPASSTAPDLTSLVEWTDMIKPDPEFVTELEAHLVELHRQKRRNRPGLLSVRRAAALAAAVAVVLAAVLLIGHGQSQEKKPSGGTAQQTQVAILETVTVIPTESTTAEQTQMAVLIQSTSQPFTATAAALTGTATPLFTGTLPPTGTATSSPSPLPSATLLPTLAGTQAPTGTPAAARMTASPLPLLPSSTPLMESTNLPTAAAALVVTPSPVPDVSHHATAAMVPPTPTPVPTFSTQYQSTLKAGEIDDNQNFSAYLQYRLDFQRFLGGTVTVHDVDISERHTIHVTTAGGLPVLGAEVTIYDRHENALVKLQTTAAGTAYFFPLAYSSTANEPSFLVVVRKGEASASFELTRENRDAVWNVTLDVPPAQPPVQLDVLFLLDSTGSMGDEIAELKNNILSISSKISALPSRPDVRFGLVTYRDRGDAYVTQTYDFTGDVGVFQAILQGVQANGGGDEPESVNEALHQAISGVHWRDGSTVKLIILVADAPPHLDYPQDYDYAQEMRRAAEMGIKIHTVASSGLNNVGEYIFRQMAQFTGGRFIFLVYDSTPQSATSSEPGAPGTGHHIQENQYTVQYLDSLVVRLITEELNALQGQ